MKREEERTKKMMDLLVIIPNPPSWRDRDAMGGGTLRTIEVLKRWTEKRVKIETVEPHPAPSLRFDVDYNVNSIGLPLLGESILIAAINLLVWTIRMTALFLKWKLHGKIFDGIVSSSSISNAFHGWFASRLFKASLILVLHERDEYISSPSVSYEKFRSFGWSKINSLLKALGDWMSSRFTKGASAFICTTAPAAWSIRSSHFLESQIYLTGNGVDLRRIGHINGEKMYDGVFLSRIEREKGVFDALKAWNIVIKHHPKARLVVVGSGSSLKNAREYVRRTKLEKNVSFTGFVSENMKYAYLKKSRIFILPTRTNLGWYMTLVEAMACGLPAICYSDPWLMTAFRDCEGVTFVREGDVRSLAREFLSLRNDERLLKYRGERSKDFVKRFCWENIASIEFDVVTEVLGL